MPAGKYAKDNPLGNIIPLDGTFVSDFLYPMSPQTVKVYIYLLYLCEHPELKLDSLNAVSNAVGCTASELDASMEYLNDHHLINYTARPFSFEILSVAAAKNSEGAYASDSLTAYADYFAGIRSLFPGRSISSSEYDKARDWVEIYGISVEAALMLISHCIETKDSAISFSYIDKAALSWANDGVTTIDAAEEYLALYNAKHHDAAKLLQYLGIKRNPTADEIRLYQTWTNEYGFDLKAIKAACCETTKISSPNFAYIGRILERLHENDLHTEKAVKAYLSEGNSDRRLVAVILSELGERNRAVSEAHIEMLKAHPDFHADTLILVARTLSSLGTHTFTKFILKLDELKNCGILTADEIKKHFEASGTQQPAAKSPKSGNYSGRNESYGDSLYADANDAEV